MRLNDLKALCKKLNLNPTPTKHRLNPDRYELSIEDCIKAVQEYSVNLLKTKGKLDSNLEFILKIKSPMLAALISKQDKKTTNNIWDDSNDEWVFEEKLDGIRCFISYNHNTNEYHIYSRALDDSTMLPIDYINRIPICSNKLPLDFILDGELIFSNDMGHKVIEEILEDPYKNISQYRPKFIIFDLIKLGEYSFINQKLSYRRTEAFKVVNWLNANKFTNINIVDQKPNSMSKEEYYNYLVHNGKEGVITKNLNSTYDIEGKRNGSWIKIKKRPYEGTASLATDTYDLFVSGYTILNNLVNGLVVSSYKVDSNNKYIIDKYGNRETIDLGILYDLTPELKTLLTTHDEENKPTLNSHFLHRVVELSSSGFDSATGKLNNLKFICWRLDRSYDTCMIKQEDIS